MKTLFIECKMGAAGDMLTAALLELLEENQKQEAIEMLKNIGLEEVEFSSEKVSKCGIQGTHVHIHIHGQEEGDCIHHHEEHAEHEHSSEHHHEHHHHLSHIVQTVSTLNLPEAVKQHTIEVYNLLAQAESHAHGVPVDQIHFHEVGEKDAIMDIASVCLLMNMINPEQIVASPVHVGSGTVHCAHGVLPVPAPATEYLLRGIPYYQGNIQSELCTPTGAALLKHFATSFGQQPMMTVEKVGVGCGKKDFPSANIVRVFLGESCTATTVSSDSTNSGDTIIELDANVDDMSAEEIGFAMDRLLESGAREVFTSSVYMKKNRPGTLITVICTQDKKEQIIEQLFKHTTTIGIRQKICNRYIQKREMKIVATPYGDVRKKISTGYGNTKSKLEYDDLARIALEKGMSLRQVRKLVEQSEKENQQ